MTVSPLIITIIVSCATFSLDHQLFGVGVGVIVAGSNAGVGVMVGTEPVNIIKSSLVSGYFVGVGVRLGVGVNALSVTTTVYLQ